MAVISKPIQTQPLGLLGFLQLKNSGRNPSEFPDLLQSTFELRDWYTEGDVRYGNGATANVGTGAQGVVTTASFAVPGEEQWIIKNILATLQLGAADAFSGYVGFQPPGFVAAGGMRVLGPKSPDTAVGAARLWTGSWDTSGGLVVAPPGSRFGVFVERALLAAPTPITLNVCYVPMIV